MRNGLMAAGLMIASVTGAQAQDAEIRDTITRQFDAFKLDDFATAFSFASPDLQRFFQTPQNFGSMVTQGYPMVWRPAKVDYLELREENGTFWQKVQIVDDKGRVHYLEYRMQQTPKGWRIGAVQILDAPGAAV
ncbi:DUF4864 domain-containing protein [Sulfitobacter sp. F26169L]|uniref:DUF4864 domain-containing protein n=1 Tax=Sulfitobacter sp. F26169L TaxID=2996015 RepID=UPI002260F91F|nr:DUF4864 domain-containing protein [Sulfitobacter sp. F26169L]MCX7567848.1 DUF4864 domain-containing protein [Sulfitobacter sp. F26169L]